MNAETSLWWSLFDLNVQAARERKVLRPSGADDLIPTDRLEFLASVTTTQYITLGRHATRGEPAGPGTASGHETPSGTGGGDSTPPTSQPAPGISPPQQDKDGTWYFSCAKCGKRKKWSPKGNAAGKAPWPGAECWDCYRGVK